MEAARWVARAEIDLRVTDAIAMLEPPLLVSAAFHLQQAAEKLLKAVLVRRQQTVPYIHDLGRLLAVLGPVNGITQELALATTELSSWAVAGRYPDIETGPDPTAAEIAAARDSVGRLRTVILAALDEG